MNKKINPQVVKSKKWLTESLLRHLEDKPYEKISIADIVKGADLSRFAFYNNFASKDDILFEYISNLFEGYFTGLEQDKTISIYESTKRFALIFQRNKKFFRMLAKNNLVYLIHKVQNKNYNRILEASLGRPSKLNDVEFEYYVSYYTSASISVMMRWIHSERYESLEYISNLVTKFRTDIDIL